MSWTDDPRGPSSDIIPVRSGIDLGNADNPFKSIHAESYGPELNYALKVYAAGTAYTLTAVSAALDFGTTDPTLTLNKAGTYLITARANLQLVGATFAANRTVTLKVRRTNNTAGDIANGSTAIGTGVTTTVTGTLAIVNLPGILYTTAVETDVITIFGDVSVVPTAGSLQATEASLVAVRLY